MSKASWLRVLHDAVFPPRCPICWSVVPQGEVLCKECEANHTPRRLLGKINAGPSGEPVVWVCPYLYEGAVREAILRFKFSQRRGAADGFAALLYRVCAELPVPDVISFVPMDRRKQQKRGYNQAQLLAERLAKLFGVPCAALLEKTRETPNQHSLHRKEREKNAAGAYRPRGEIQGKAILLCDDVITTGATLGECARVLRQAGAASVAGTAIALTKGML